MTNHAAITIDPEVLLDLMRGVNSLLEWRQSVESALAKEHGKAIELKSDDHYDPSESRDSGGRWTAGGGGSGGTAAALTPFMPIYHDGATAQNVGQAAKYVRSMGVDVEFAGSSKIAATTNHPDDLANAARYDPIDGKVYLNEKNGFWNNPVTIAAYKQHSGRIASSDPSHPAAHAVGMALFASKNGASKADLAYEQPIDPKMVAHVRKTVSSDAIENRAAFVGETFAGMASGKHYDAKVMGLYRNYGGPELSEAKKLGGKHPDPEAAPRKLDPLPPRMPVDFHKGDKAGNIDKAAKAIEAMGLSADTHGYEPIHEVVGSLRMIGVVAAYSDNRDKVLFNESQSAWDDPVKKCASLHASGYTSSPAPDHFINHEAAHGRQRAELGLRDMRAVSLSKFAPGESKVAATVSKYSTSAPGEFVAEVFAGSRAGKSYPKPVMDLYAKYKGPSLR